MAKRKTPKISEQSELSLPLTGETVVPKENPEVPAASEAILPVVPVTAPSGGGSGRPPSEEN